MCLRTHRPENVTSFLEECSLSCFHSLSWFGFDACIKEKKEQLRKDVFYELKWVLMGGKTHVLVSRISTFDCQQKSRRSM